MSNKINTELAFVILHYKTYEDTVNCIESIIKNVPEAPIVVVDNGSNNESGEKLRLAYQKCRSVSIIQLNRNIGFSCGNNVGIKYAREHFLPRFIAVINNDTLILQNDFLDIIEKEFKESSFSILGPQIINKDGTNYSNPVEYIVDTKYKAICLMIKRYIKLILNELYLGFLLHDAGTHIKIQKKYDNLQRYENVKLHGACWIFSVNYFKYYNGLNPDTFLYFEEDILYLDAVKKGLLTVYNPKLNIIHLEDSSTNSIVRNHREKNIFVLKNEINSLKVLLKKLTILI